MYGGNLDKMEQTLTRPIDKDAGGSYLLGVRRRHYATSDYRRYGVHHDRCYRLGATAQTVTDFPHVRHGIYAAPAASLQGKRVAPSLRAHKASNDASRLTPPGVRRWRYEADNDSGGVFGRPCLPIHQRPHKVDPTQNYVTASSPFAKGLEAVRSDLLKVAAGGGNHDGLSSSGQWEVRGA